MSKINDYVNGLMHHYEEIRKHDKKWNDTNKEIIDHLEILSNITPNIDSRLKKLTELQEEHEKLMSEQLELTEYSESERFIEVTNLIGVYEKDISDFREAAAFNHIKISKLCMISQFSLTKIFEQNTKIDSLTRNYNNETVN